MSIKKNLLAVLILILAGFLWSASDTVDLTVTVVGDVFTMELQDSNGFPLAGEIDLGRLSPGQEDFPVNGVVVAGCKSNREYQWSLQAEAEPLVDRATGREMSKGLKVRGLDSTRSPGGKELPGNLIGVAQDLGRNPLRVYTSNMNGDIGFNNSEGTYVALGFGVSVPAAQPAGTYSGRVLLTLTE